jgi:branched-chain amino acid transport system permease protein
MRKKSLIACALILLVLLPLVVKNPYILHLVIYTCMYSVLGMSFSMMWKNRLITAGTAGFWAVGGYTSALLVTKLAVPFWLAMPAGGVASALFALFIFSIALRGGPLVFFSVSLVSAFIVMEVLGTVSFFGGWEGLLDIPGPRIGPYLFFTKTSFYYLVLAILVLNVAAFHALYTSRIGRAWTAIGSSTRLAEVQGVNIYRYRLAASVIGCFWAGVIGSFYAHYQNLLIPTTFSFLCSIYVQMYALIGGLNYFIAGPIVGSFVMVFLPELLRAGQEYQPIFFGVLLILIIIFLPGGLLSIGERLPWLGRLGGRIGRRLRLVSTKS